MAIPFHIPGEQSNNDVVVTQRLLDLLHQLLYEILLQRQPGTPLNDTLESVNEQTENEVVPNLETPFVDYDVQTQVKKKKINRRRFKTEELVVPDAPIAEPQRSICPDWIGVGQNLRKIADNFHSSKACHEPEVPEYFDTNTDLLTTIVSLSPFRDSLWSAVFVVGYRILSNNAR